MKQIFKYDRIADQECELAPLSPRELENFLLQPGDLLFARQSLTFEGAGRCVLVMEGEHDRTWESHLIRVRLDKSLAVPAFYFYFFRSPQGERKMKNIVHQVAAAGIRGSELATLSVPKPHLRVQRAIAEVLGALDDKIAANTKLAGAIEEVLETEAKLKWFQSATDERVALTTIVELNPSTSKPAEAEPAYIDMKKLPESGSGIATAEHRVAKGGTRFMKGDTLMARITPCLENRKTGFVDSLSSGQVGVGSTEFIALRAREPYAKPISYFVAVDDEFRDFAIRHMVGTSGRQRVSATDLAQYEIPMPDEPWIQDFGRRATQQFEYLTSLRIQNVTLATIRDTLLSQLMSGKVRVRDAERTVSGVV